METIWITGASSGIGEACAYRYASQGDQLILTSSSRERLDVVAERCRQYGAADVFVLPSDLSDLEGVGLLVRQAWDRFGGIDILFLNAGISQRTSVEDTTMDMVRQIMEINFFAPVAITKAILPMMLNAGGGNIAVTTSIAGKFGFPLRCAYSSSKHALYGFFETLRTEYYNKYIRVTIVCPGRVRTNISLRALDKGGKPHGIMDPGQDKGMKVEDAARKIVKAIRKGKREVFIGRCIGTPGDTLLIDSLYTVDSSSRFAPDSKILYRYPHSRVALLDSLLLLLHIPQGRLMGKDSTHCFRSFSRYEHYLLEQAMNGRCWLTPADPQDSAQQLHPLIVPGRHRPVRVYPWNITLLRNTLVLHEGKQAEIRHDTLYVEGKPTQHCTFTKNYYWVCANNSVNLSDSRLFGFVPQDHLIGRATRVWFSKEPESSLFSGYRWHRIGKKIE